MAVSLADTLSLMLQPLSQGTWVPLKEQQTAISYHVSPRTAEVLRSTFVFSVSLQVTNIWENDDMK